LKNEYYIDTVDPIVIIYLNNGLSTIIDLEDFSKLDENFTYFANPKNYVFRMSSRKDEGKRKAIYLHRELMNCPDGMMIDHINGDRLDNRKSNLRIVTNAQNSQNRHGNYKGSKSGLRGAVWCERDNGWIARVKLNGKQHYLGTYKTPEEAFQKASEFRNKYMPYSEEDI
jgi:hypothetical protein